MQPNGGYTLCLHDECESYTSGRQGGRQVNPIFFTSSGRKEHLMRKSKKVYYAQSPYQGQEESLLFQANHQMGRS